MTDLFNRIGRYPESRPFEGCSAMDMARRKHDDQTESGVWGSFLVRFVWFAAIILTVSLFAGCTAAQEGTERQTWVLPTEIEIDVSQFVGGDNFRWYSVPTFGRAECFDCNGVDVGYQVLSATEHFRFRAQDLFREFGTLRSELVPSFGHESYRTSFLDRCEVAGNSCTATSIILPDGRSALSAIETRDISAGSGPQRNRYRHILRFQSQDRAILMSAVALDSDIAAHNLQALFDQIIPHYPVGPLPEVAPQSTATVVEDIPPFPPSDLPVGPTIFAGGAFTDWYGEGDRASTFCWDCGLARVSVVLSVDGIEENILTLQNDSPNVPSGLQITAFGDAEYVQALQRSCDHYSGSGPGSCAMDQTVLSDGRPSIVMTQTFTEEVWNLEDRYVPITQTVIQYLFLSQSSVITIQGTAETVDLAQQNAESLMAIALPNYPQ